MGQRTGLSAGDIAGVLAMYPSSHPTFKEVPKDPVTDPGPTRKEVTRDPVNTVKEVNKDPIRETVKEVGKDPVRDPSVKEVRKDPVSDPTIKEVRKDPVRETTIKETALDPIGRPGPFGPGPMRASASPFILATPNRAGAAGDALDEVSAAAEQVEQLAAAIGELEAQHSELVAAYDAATQLLAALQGQG
jgi:hypothetical protein